MKETQETVHQWIDETFPGTDPESPRKSLRALEEMVELCLAFGTAPREITATVNRALEDADAARAHFGGWSEEPSEPQPDKIPVEAADVLIVLYGVAGMRGFDLHAEVEKKMAVNRARKWQAMGDGTGYHVKPS